MEGVTVGYKRINDIMDRYKFIRFNLNGEILALNSKLHDPRYLAEMHSISAQLLQKIEAFRQTYIEEKTQIDALLDELIRPRNLGDEFKEMFRRFKSKKSKRKSRKRSR